MKLEVIILSAGQGKRMKSAIPKVLHHLAGCSLLGHVINQVKDIPVHKLHIVVGHGGDQVRQAFDNHKIHWVTQDQQLGTGHAVMQAIPKIDLDSLVLILYGDVPLTSAATLMKLINIVRQDTIAMLTVRLDDPTGYGRIIRNEDKQVCAIVEEKDATSDQKLIAEVNTGIMLVPAKHLKRWLPQLSAENAQSEYYLTDIIAMAAKDNIQIKTVTSTIPQEVQGINSRTQLAILERWYQRQQAIKLMDNGATLADPARLDVRGVVKCGQDVFIDINVIFEGEVYIGNGVQIGPNVLIRNSTIADGVCIEANCVIDAVIIDENSQIGPFARLRPGTKLSKNTKIGNFVETKNATIGAGSKVNHLSYIGDAVLGKDVNIGAGTITCNYDGANKFLTEIDDQVFVGSNTALIAPIKIGANATIGAGSTISKAVAVDSLVVVRGKLRNVDGWKRPSKK